MSFGWAYVAGGSKRMPKGGAAVALCHQYGLHCSHGLFIGLLRMDRLHRKKMHARATTRRPCRGWPSACDKRCALMEEALRPDERGAPAIIPPTPVEQTAAPERRSTRSFGEYPCLEDSRYASQPKNISDRIR